MSKPHRIRSFSWEPHTKTIRRQLAKMPQDRFSRTDIEAMFGVRRDAAQRLMRTVGAEIHGGSLFVTKRELQRYLAAILRSADYARDESRRQRVQAALESASRQWELKSTATGVTSREFQKPQYTLPEGVALAAGSLRIDFQDGAQLIRRLALFAAWCGQNQHELMELN